MQDIKIDNNWFDVDTNKYKCPICEKLYSKMGISTHIWRTHGNGKDFVSNPKGSKTAWNIGKTYEELLGKDKSDAMKNKTSESLKGRKHKPLTDKHKHDLSEKMKLAHKEGRAWNIGKSRWNNKKSYPETFFERVINNDFNDKNYVCEHPIGIYSFDFAWTDKKKAIEIDGEQHQRFQEYIDRDLRKETFAKDNGWEILRIVWKDMFHDTQTWIAKAKEFIDN